MEDKKSFGVYVSKRRKEIGLTQKEFAEKLYVTESAVSKWERGISYPDITLIRDMCDVLAVSEHELLTASEDVEARNSEKLAKKYLNLIIRYRNTLGFLYGLSLLVCFICNIATLHNLSWFFIVLTAEMVAASLTLVPVLVQEKKSLISLGAFVVSLCLLLLVCNVYTNGNWFFVAFISVIFGVTLIFLPFILNSIWLPDYFTHKKTLIYFFSVTFLLILLLCICNFFVKGGWFFNTALPIALYTLILPWGLMFIIRYIKVNNYFKAAGCFALASIFEYCTQAVISLILKDKDYGFGFHFNFLQWNKITINGNINMIIFMVLLATTILLTIMGSLKAVQKSN